MPDEFDRLKSALADRYAIEREIGAGGMATVYLAADLKHRRKVAIKVLRPELAATLGAERFLREIEISANLTHTHILALHDSGEANGFLYYVMPYIEGESLRDRLLRERQLSIEDALALTREVASALGYAHDQGVIHRDIKPENIMLSAGGAVVADFGIARALSAAGGEQLTETGMAVGTPAYMSPEQATGERDIDARSDIYSLGCVLYEMLAGDAPYVASTPRAVIAKKLSEPIPRIAVVRESTPPAIEAALDKALAKNPIDRFATAEAFALALESTDGVSASVVDAGERPGKRLTVLALVGVLILAVAFVGWKYVFPAVSSGTSTIRSITVLPVDSPGEDSASAVLALGLTVAINTRLSQIEALRSKGHLSAERYRGTDKSVAQITAELEVDALLVTHLLRMGDRVQVHAQVLNAAEESVWADQYDYAIGDVLVLASAVARDISAGVRASLSMEDEALLATARTVNPQAYEEYSWGLHFWTQRGEGLKRGLEHLQRAIELDSGFADAWAGLADAYNLLGFYHFMRPNVALPRGREAAQRALLLDPSSARAHTALAFVHGWYDYSFDASLAEFARALELDPEYWVAHAWECNTHTPFGDFDEALAAGLRAVEGDPFFPINHMAYGWCSYFAGNLEEAVLRFRRVLDLTPESPVGRRLLGQALTELARYDEAEGQLRAALSHPWHTPRVEAQLAYLLGVSNHRDSAQVIIADLKRRRVEQALDTIIQPYVSAFDLAVAHAGLGDSDSTFVWLNEAYNERPLELVWLGVDPRFRQLRSDPRCQELLVRMGVQR